MTYIMYDFERIKKDLKDYYMSAYFTLGYGASLVNVSNIEILTNEELLVLVQNIGLNLDDYVLKDYGSFYNKK
ncbi:MAG: hypothetical protein GX951_00675 [Mollicutes bacterium]|nr:hypothetical protein [Mollicutes bacterium]